MNEILVSINCITYNHEDYIEDAIKGFLLQKTNFKFEILIHDDASTDNTVKIIKKYEKKYSDIIKPIYQKENQYSKNIKISNTFQYPRAKGKYIAICEGDDYWSDPYKLQKQIDYMEKNKDCSMCFHSVNCVKDNKIINKIRPYNKNKRVITEDIILGGGGFIGTNSIIFKKQFVISMVKMFEEFPIGDYPLQVITSTDKYAYYMDEVMSSYRVFAKNSWSMKNIGNIKRQIKLRKSINSMLKALNKYTNYKYNKHFKKMIYKNKVKLYIIKYLPKLYVRYSKKKGQL